jgi:hypothetical protein
MHRLHPSSGRHATRADINRNGRPTSIGMPGRHHRNPQPGDRRITPRALRPGGRRPIPAGPAPQGGGMVKAAWFSNYAPNERPDKFDRIVQSWDTANKASELSDFSVCTTWGIKEKDLYLLHVLRKHGISRAEAHGARAVPSLRRECRADRGQSLGHAADPGADPGRPACRHPLRACTRRPR